MALNEHGAGVCLGRSISPLDSRDIVPQSWKFPSEKVQRRPADDPVQILLRDLGKDDPVEDQSFQAKAPSCGQLHNVFFVYWQF